jgi:hypothetical protein
VTRPASARRSRRRLGATAAAIFVALVGLLGATIQAGWIPPPRTWFGHHGPTAGPDCGAPVCLDPTTGSAGTLVALHGTGFGPDENVTVRLGEDEVSSAHTDTKGAFDASLTIPSSYAGRGRIELTISVVGQTSGKVQSAVFVLTAS